MRRSSADPCPGGDEIRRTAEFGDLLARYIEEVNATGFVDPDAVLENHPRLGPAILEDLEMFVRFRSGDEAGPQQPLGAIGDYTLRRQIGRGGMGVVYEAWENSMDRRVALKVLPPGVAADPKACVRFLREAQTAGKLSHPNVVPVFFTGIREQTPFYAMEFVEGETLAQVLARQNRTPEDAESPFGPRSAQQFYFNLAEVFAGAADGLQHAHSRGVIHRDLKPSNLILDRRAKDSSSGAFTLRILDFGLAHLEGRESLTASGDFLGTPLYMSPEQARRRKIPVDHRTDIYSLGATLYEMLAGHPPLRGKDYQDTLSQIVERDPVEPRKVDARIPRDLEMIVLKCLRKEAAGRYGTAEALAQDLRRFVRGDPIEARPESRLERLSRRLRRNRAVLLAGAVLVLLLGAVGWQAAERYIAEQEARDAVRLLHDATVRDAAIEIFAGQQELLGRSSEELSKFLYVYRGWRYRKGVAGVADTLWALEQAAEAAPGRPDAPYYLARLYRLAGDEESAAREAARALERAPDFVPAAILAREIALDRGRLGETEIEPLLERFGGKPEPNWQEPWLLAYRHVQIRAWPEAVEAYRKLLQYREPEPYVGFTVEALMGCGLARLQTGEFLGATSDFAAARGIWPKLSDAGFALGMAWHHAGQEEEAERVFLELHGESPEGSRSEIAAWITGVYWMAGEAAKAREWLERVESPDRDGIDCNGLYLRGRYEECIKKAQQVLETYPDAYFTLFQLCWAKLQLQWHRRGPRWDDERREILEIARKAIDLYPNDRHAKVQLAYALQVNGRPEEALRTIENAVRSTSRISDVLDYDLVVYGVILRLQGKLQKAEEVLLEAVENCPRFKYFFAFELARTYECAGRDEEAEREYRALTAGGGGSANVYGCLAGVLNRLGRYKEAADAAKEALRRLPKNTCAHEELARALWKLGRSEEAIEAADVGIQEIPGREHLYLLKGKIVEDLGKVEEAAKEYCLELDLRLDDPETHEALRGLLKRTPELASIPEVAAVADAIERRVSDGSRDAFVLETLSLIRKSEKEAIGAPAHTGK